MFVIPGVAKHLIGESASPPAIGSKYRKIPNFNYVFHRSFVFHYFHLTESRGQGDLRFYFLVQFLPMLLIPLILVLFKPNGFPKVYFWLVLLAYVVAKVFEIKDAELFHSTGISGHSIKHLMAAVAPLIFLTGLRKTLNRA